MGAVAGEAGIHRVVLPHYQPDELAALLAWRHPKAEKSDGPFEALIEQSRAYFNGQDVLFDDIPVELPPAGAFAGIVLRACREIGWGRTMSYSQVAMKIGREDAARAVATALSKNPTPLVIPCHRVTYADGRPGGFSAEGGPALKQRMLAMERGGG